MARTTALFHHLEGLGSVPYVAGATLGYAALRTAPAYLAVSGAIAVAVVISLLAFAWVITLLVLAVRRRQHTVFRAAAECTGAVFAGWLLAGLATTPARTALDPSLTLRAILGPLLAASVIVIPVSVLIAALLVMLGRKIARRPTA